MNRSLGLVLFATTLALVATPVAAAPRTDAVPRRGLALWLRADGDTVMEGGSLVQWSDMSGQGNHARRIAGAKQNPANPQLAKAPSGSALLRWDGSDSSFSFRPITDIRTFFWVLKKDRRSFDPQNQRFILGDVTNSPRYDSDFHVGTHHTGLIWHETLSSPFLRAGQNRLNGLLVDPTLTEMPTELAVLSVVTTGKVVASQLSRDRNSDGRAWWGDLAEVLVYTVPLTDAERDSVERHLMKKYGIRPGVSLLDRPATPGKPRLVIAKAHTAPVTAVAFHPDGKTLASASFDQSAKLWDAATGTLARTLEGHGKRVWSASFSPDGKTVLTSGADGTARVWTIADGQLKSTLTPESNTYRAAFSPDGKRIATVGRSHSGYSNHTWVSIWETGRAKLWDVLEGHDAHAYWVAFSPDGEYVASSSEDKTLRLWATINYKPLATIDTGSTAYAFAISPDSKTIVSANVDGTLRFFAAHKAMLNRTRRAHAGAAMSVVYSPDGKLVASAGTDGAITCWESATGDLVQRFAASDDELWAVAFSPDGKSLASGGRDGAIKVWPVPALPAAQAALP